MPEARRRRGRARRPLKWLGKSIGSTAKGMWRVVRRDRRRTAPMASISAAMLENCSASDDLSDWSSCRQEYEPLQLQLPSLPSLQQLQQLPSWLAGFLQAPADKAAADGLVNGSMRSSLSSTANIAAEAPPVVYSSSSSKKARFPPAVQQQQQQQQQQEDAVLLVSSSSRGVQLLGEMLNLQSTFPMLLHTVSGSSSSNSSAAAEPNTAAAAVSPAGNSSSSSGGFGRPQQLLTVGCRNWGNWWDGRGLLRVKIYDFAIYMDGEQAERFVPTDSSSSSSNAPSLLDSATALTDKQQQQQQQQGVLQRQQQRLQQLLLSQRQHQEPAPLATVSSSSNVQVDELPDLLKSHSSGVCMSLILRAARDVPLQLLSEEYEKVLKRRLDRAGGSAADTVALKQLLATFSDPMRLPPAVRAGKPSSSSSSSKVAGDSEVARAAAGGSEDGAGGGGGSVAKGAMLVFERSGGGTITARIGPHILGAVQSPKLAEALFDLYLGDQPVSKTAKDAAAQTLNRIAASSNSSSSSRSGAYHPYYLPQSKGEEIKCEGLAGGGLGRFKASGSKGALGLGVSDLAACVLHMG